MPVEVKVEFLTRLAAAGPGRAGGDQLRAPEVGAAAGRRGRAAGPAASGAEGVDYPVLVPNERGLDRALDAGVEHVAIFASATETFAQRNLNRTLDAQFAMFEPVVTRALRAGLRVRGYVSMCFGDPWEGAVAPEQVAAVGRRLVEHGLRAALAGRHHRHRHAGPRRRRAGRLRRGRRAGRRSSRCTSTTPTARRWPTRWPRCARGVTTVDASAGGLGGCPYAESATGNLATEDLVWMLDGLGIEHGVDLDALVATSVWMAEQLGRPSPSRVVRALHP